MKHEKAVVLFGHGARDPQWAEPMRRIRERLLAQAPGVAVELAFLEFIAPALHEAIDALVAEGVASITVIPVFLAQGGHLKKDVPVLIDAARTRHPECAIHLTLAVGEADEVVEAIAGFARSCVQAV
ncbi:MAG: CbiX/SirB N-terminal domain-containing protein [Rhodocyclaceae bacterium]|jgi:sirohydrochlorin cobaltochelatase|nr:CbiX/SirB N-terminal domain-containing protein [Rhodocyclaceae bacterium]MCL4758849.1 CbiX/SirB N-terminal domain-containing protein [Rhodocyclaceae bacterium]